MSNENIEEFRGVVISKGGRLIRQQWVYPEFDDETDEIIKEGYMKKEDVTEFMSAFLFEICMVENGATLRDLFKICDENRSTLGYIFQRYYFVEFLDKGLNMPLNNHLEQGVIESNGCRLKDIEVSIDCIIQNDDEQPVIFDYDFGSNSFPLTEAEAEKQSFRDAGHIISYDLGGKLDDVMDLPLIINKNVSINIDEKWIKITDNFDCKLGDIINGIFAELSFYGSPEKSKAFFDSLKDDDEVEDENN